MPYASHAKAWPERYTCFRSGEMNDELQDLLNAGYKPVVVGPQPFSFEDLLRSVDPVWSENWICMNLQWFLPSSGVGIIDFEYAEYS
jgi:hypothetical protein